MVICTRSNRDDFAGATRGLKRALSGAAITGGYGHNHSCIDGIVEPDCQQIVVTMIAAAKRQVENVHAVFDSCINSVQDVFAASVQNASGKNVVISQPSARRDPGHIINAHAIYNRSFAGYSGGNSSCMCAMILDGLSVQTLLVVLIEKNFGNYNLFRDVIAVLILVMRSAISCIALRKTRRIAKAGWVKEGMCVVDTGVDISDLNAGAGSRSTASGSPRVRRVDDFVALAQSRMVKRIVLGALHDGTCVIHVGSSGDGISVYIRSRRAAYTKCNNAQANSREYQNCCEYFFHRVCVQLSRRQSKLLALLSTRTLQEKMF